MVSQDVEDSLSKRTFKWLVLSILGLAVSLGIAWFGTKKQDSLELSIFIVFIIFTLVAFLISIFNAVVWLKIKAAIRSYHTGNYERAKEIAISAYKLSNYKEINDLIDYIDSQIIDEIVTQQERLEQDEPYASEYLQDIDDLIEEIELRIKRLEKKREEISEKLKELKENDQQQSPEIRSQYYQIINQYTDLLRFTQHKINAYQEVLNKLIQVKQSHQRYDKLLKEHEDLRDLQEEILTEGYTTEDDEDMEEERSDFLQNEKVFLEYVKEFLASTTSIDEPEDFSRIYKEFCERLEDLDHIAKL